MNKQRTINIPHNNPEYKSNFISLHLLLSSIENSEMQILRIELDKEKSDIKTLFADIQFFLITVSNIQKMMLRLRKLFRKDKDYMIFYKKYIKEIEYLDSFRDNLEHFDERLDGRGKKGKSLSQPNMLGNLFGDEYNFGGETFNLKNAFSLVKELKKDLIEWNRINYQFPL
ncbi:hypothetical protein ACFL0A_01040 [Patescibacteria group bacterium]